MACWEWDWIVAVLVWCDMGDEAVGFARGRLLRCFEIRVRTEIRWWVHTLLDSADSGHVSGIPL